MTIELEKIKAKEEKHNEKCFSEKYYWSEEAKIIGKQIETEKESYLQNNPTDYLIRGTEFHKILWSSLKRISEEEQEIFILTGKGLYDEQDNKNYLEAISYYERAIELNNQVCAKDIQELIDLKGSGDYIYAKSLKQRIRVCEKRSLSTKCKKLEKEAKELEKTNPQDAISIYNELNVLKPGLKKYNKRIEICKKKLNRD